MKIEPGNYCPLIKKNCIGLQCSWFTQIRGTNPNTGEPVDEWGCAVTWMPVLAVEVAQKSNQTGAAVESFRNEVVNANYQNQQLYKEALKQQIIPAQITPLDQPINILPNSKNNENSEIEDVDCRD
jgi:hypothetical protein